LEGKEEGLEQNDMHLLGPKRVEQAGRSQKNGGDNREEGERRAEREKVFKRGGVSITWSSRDFEQGPTERESNPRRTWRWGDFQRGHSLEGKTTKKGKVKEDGMSEAPETAAAM